jgi:hypothetical protein
VNGTAGKYDTAKALAMLDAFASVGASAFDVTLLDVEGKEQVFQRNRSLDELRRTISRRLEAATRAQLNIVIRPRSATVLFVQLDDFDDAKARRMEPYSFLTLCTSPNNYQVWLAVSDGPKESEKEAARHYRTRVRRGAGADQSATGATRIAGSLNFKAKYAPDFPLVTLSQVSTGRVTTVAALEHAGIVAPEKPPLPPASVPPRISPPRPWASRRWPDYQQSLRGAPLKGDGTPDRSRADFMFCKWSIERGWSIQETAEKLAEVSAKAQERIRVKDDKGYPLLTARNAADAVARERAGTKKNITRTHGPE